ncbi:MAG: histidine kinase [Comamonadaceae bacterium]|jgi:transcriptional regulator of acetoin/glycerol metabolism|nr:MAG: histidine kinase [Comamonadaceae bacterium]
MTKPTDIQAALRLTTITQARRAVLQDHASPVPGWIAPWIERSWQRCISLGLQPQQAVSFDAISQQQMRHTADANQHLVETAGPMLEKLGRAIINTRYFAILTNVDGVVIAASGAIDRSDRRANNITRIGTDLSERRVGTTAIGAALTDLQPVWLHRGEHFFSGTSHYSCAGAPLFGPNGACVGMLDLTGIDAVERPELKHLVAQSAQKIENALVQREAHSLTLRLNWPGTNLGSEADGLLCLDHDGWIVAANQVARQMVPNLPSPAQSSVHVSSVFGMAYELLFDALRRPDSTLEVPLWTGLRLQALPIERSCESLPVRPGADATQRDNLHLKDIEISLIHRAVQQTRGNVAEAARALGISRATVYRKLGNPK